MTKTSKNKSKQRNWFQTQPYFVGSVFRLVKWHHFFFCLAQVFLSILLLGQVSSFAALHPFQLSWLCSFYVVFTFFSWLSQSSHYLRLLCAQNASLPLKEFLCSGRNLLALLENVPYTVTPPTSGLLLLHWCLHLPRRLHVQKQNWAHQMY